MECPIRTRKGIKMYEHEIPFHIQEEIMKRLPVKSLIQFRSVSKAWKSLIDSSDFIAAHSLLSHTRPHHLLVGHHYFSEEKIKFACFVDDETLFEQRPLQNSLTFVKESGRKTIFGISQGLVCFYCSDTMLAVLWNPSIRKSVAISIPGTPIPYLGGQQLFGFGVCLVTSDPKVVTVTQSWDVTNIEASYRCKCMVYTLSSGEWRTLTTNLPTKPIEHWYRVVTAGGFIYWYGRSPSHRMIISFDVTNETFQMIDLPEKLARSDFCPLHIHNLRESLVIPQYNGSTYTVWRMEDVIQRSFTKLFTIHARFNSIRGFTKSGVPILLVEDNEQSKLVVYEPNSQHNNVFEISEHPLFFTVRSYTETLLLLGRSDCSSY